jgi:hypothetical protein
MRRKSVVWAADSVSISSSCSKMHDNTWRITSLSFRAVSLFLLTFLLPLLTCLQQVPQCEGNRCIHLTSTWLVTAFAMCRIRTKCFIPCMLIHRLALIVLRMKQASLRVQFFVCCIKISCILYMYSFYRTTARGSNLTSSFMFFCTKLCVLAEGNIRKGLKWAVSTSCMNEH